MRTEAEYEIIRERKRQRRLEMLPFVQNCNVVSNAYIDQELTADLSLLLPNGKPIRLVLIYYEDHEIPITVADSPITFDYIANNIDNISIGDAEIYWHTHIRRLAKKYGVHQHRRYLVTLAKDYSEINAAILNLGQFCQRVVEKLDKIKYKRDNAEWRRALDSV